MIRFGRKVFDIQQALRNEQNVTTELPGITRMHQTQDPRFKKAIILARTGVRHRGRKTQGGHSEHKAHGA